MEDIELIRRAAAIAAKSKCWIGIGCVIARDGKILAEAWNETLRGEEYCVDYRTRIKTGVSLPYLPAGKRPTSRERIVREVGEWQAKAGGKETPDQKPKDNVGCIRHELGLSQGREIEKACSIHAEASAIAKAARGGIKIEGATMFVTSFPCLICIRSIIAAGIKKVVYMNDFYKPHHEEMLEKNGIEVQQVIEKDVWKTSGHSVLDTESI